GASSSKPRQRPPKQQQPQQHERQSRAPHDAEARVEKHRPSATVEADINEWSAKNVRCKQHQPGRTREDRHTEPNPGEDGQLASKPVKLDFRTGWLCYHYCEGDGPTRQQRCGKMQAAYQDQRIGHRWAPSFARLWSDAKGEIALRAMGVHGQHAPDHFVIARRQSFERDAQLRAVSANRGLTGSYRRTLLVTYFNGAECRLELLREPQHHFLRCWFDHAAHARIGMIKESMRRGKGRRRVEKGCDNEDMNGLAHNHRPNIGLPELMLLAKIGRPMLVGKISSRKKCSCPITPTLVPLCRLTGISASTATWKVLPT